MLLDLITSLAGGVQNPALLVTEIFMVLFIVVFSLSVHESAHAYVAKRLGDPTAANMGRVSLNPLRHLDPFGFLMMALVGIGFAKPVPINARNFRDPRKGMMLSSLAGPLSNFLVAVIATLIFWVVNFGYVTSNVSGSMNEGVYYIFQALLIFFYNTAFMNFALAVFNLIPCPPFDGSRIFFYFLPKDWYFKVMRYERYLGIGMLVLFILLNRIGWNPISAVADGLFTLVGKPLQTFFSMILRAMYS